MNRESGSGDLSPTAALATLLAAWSAYFGLVLLPGRTFAFRDLFYFHRPLREAFVRSVLSGQGVFVNPALNLGQPMLSDPSYSVFYPTNLLFFALPFEAAWNLTLAGHVLLGAGGLYLLARVLGASRGGALAGAFAFGFSGPLLSALNYYSLLLAMSWVPLVLFFVLRALRNGGRWVALAGLALGVQALTLEPTVLAGTWTLAAAGWLLEIRGSVNRGRVALRAGLAAATGLLISLVQALPALLWLPHSGRAGGLDFRSSAAWFSLHPQRLLELVAPLMNGDAMGRSASEFWGGPLSDGGFPYLPRLSIGLLALVLAPLAARTRAGRAALLLVGSSLVLALGHHLPGFHALYTAFPPLRFVRYPEKLVLFAALGLAIAMALALSDSAWRPSVLLSSGLGLAVCLLAALALAPPGLDSAQVAERTGGLLQAALMLAALVAIGLLRAKGLLGRAGVFALPLVALVDVLSGSWNVPQTSPIASGGPPAVMNAVPELASTPILPVVELESDAFFSAGIPPEVALGEGVYPYSGLGAGVSYGSVNDISRTMSRGSAERRSRILAAFPGPVALAEMRRAGIGFVVSTKSIEAPGLEEVARIAVSPRLDVVVTKLLGGWAPRARLLRGPGSVSVEEAAPHLLRLHVEAPVPVDVVLTKDAIPGWQVRRAERPEPDPPVLSGARVGRTPDGLLAVSVPKGVHDLTLAYRPPGLSAGLALGAAGILLAAYLLARPLP